MDRLREAVRMTARRGALIVLLALIGGTDLALAQASANPNSRVTPSRPGPKAVSVSRDRPPDAGRPQPPVDPFTQGFLAGVAAAGGYGPAYLYWYVGYGTPGAVQPGGYVQQAPPAPQAEAPGPPPGPATAWIPGFWNWTGAGWNWVDGRWVAIPGGALQWIPGRWQHNKLGWYWLPGFWR